nr:ComEC/Rec2 family competence protein [uncultured Dethiosulfovibrio sp.]
MDLLAEAPSLVILAAACISAVLWGSPILSGAVAGLVSLGISLVVCAKWDRGRLVVTFIVVIVSLLSSWWCSTRLDSVSPPLGMDSGEIVLERSWGKRVAMVIKGDQGSVVAKVAPERSFLEGTKVEWTGRIEPLMEPRAGNPFDERAYWLARGVTGVLVPKEMEYRRDGGGIHYLRSVLRERIQSCLPPLTKGYLLAALLGDRDPELVEPHSRWGTAHLLAVSGFHVGLVALLAWAFPWTGRWKWIVVSAFMWLYVLLAGAAASALRAALMVQVALLGLAFGRRSSVVNSVAVASLALLMYRPWWFWDLGWRLSVVSALAISALMTVKVKRRWITVLCASPLLWTVTAPMISGAFKTVPLAGAVLNMVALPAFSVLLPLAVLFSLPSLMGIPGGALVAVVPEGAFALWGYGASMTEGLPVLRWSPWMVSLSCLSLGAILSIRFRVSPVRAGVLALALALFVAYFLN